MDFDHIIVKESPGLCRCCLSEGCYKDLSTEYPWMEDTEVYADMLLECFDISISQHIDGPNGPNRLICEVCITRLRDACNFKKQVLESEKKFVDMIGRGEFRSEVIYEDHMKDEMGLDSMPMDAEGVEFIEDDFDNESLKDEATSTLTEVTATPLPVKAKKGRPKKRLSGEKTEKKAKVAKLEDKPRTSKSVSKDFQIFCRLGSSESQLDRKIALRNFLTTILESSTIMPFRWYSNKYMCFFCCAAFVDSFYLKQHTKEEHSDAKLRNVLRNIRDLGYARIKLDISEISCKRCLKSFRNFQEYLDHLVDEHEFKYDKDLLQNLYCFKLSDNGMCCPDCGKEFRFFGPLLSHVHKCLNRMNTYLCEVCGQGFISKSALDAHVRAVHSSEASKCSKCNRMFPSQYALNCHFAKTHKFESFPCSKCPEKFKSRYLKKRHLALVHDVKNTQFFCEQCPKMFTSKSALVQHVARVHLKEKSFSCDICGFRVFSRELLKRHMVKHDDSRPYQCDFCKKSFQRQKTLDVHRRIHTNDRRYSCKDCGKAFVQVSSLKLHVRVHHSVANDT